MKAASVGGNQAGIERADDLATGADALCHGDGGICGIEREQLAVAAELDVAHAVHDKDTHIAGLGKRVGDEKHVAVVIVGLHTVPGDGHAEARAAHKRIARNGNGAEGVRPEIHAQTRGGGLFGNAEKNGWPRGCGAFQTGEFLMQDEPHKALAVRIERAIERKALGLGGGERRRAGSGRGVQTQQLIHRDAQEKRQAAQTREIGLALARLIAAISAGGEPERLGNLKLRQPGALAGGAQTFAKEHDDSPQLFLHYSGKLAKCQ